MLKTQNLGNLSILLWSDYDYMILWSKIVTKSAVDLNFSILTPKNRSGRATDPYKSFLEPSELGLSESALRSTFTFLKSLKIGWLDDDRRDEGASNTHEIA